MDPRTLVQPLEPSWQGIIDDVLLPMRRPPLSTRDVAWLAARVEELSLAYNSGRAEGRRTKLPLEARVAFSFPRDVPKGAAAVRELVATGALAVPEERPLRVLDLGAGLGAMTWGLVRALASAGATGRVEALLVDEDEDVLLKAVAIARAARAKLGAQPLELNVTPRVGALGEASTSALPSNQDVVFLGQVLSELSPADDAAARIERHASLILHLLDAVVADDGALVVVEPALRERSRHLHEVRDRVRALRDVNVFAPCLHARPCPMLAAETDWCHEDLPIDLPPWVVPIARAAGLRWQGLTFSYLVLCKEGPDAASRFSRTPAIVRFRAVSELLRSKGKVEMFVCDEDGVHRRIRRLDRDAGRESGVSFEALRRGDIVTLGRVSRGGGGQGPSDGDGEEDAAAPLPLDGRGRVTADVHVSVDVGACRK